MNGNFPVEAIFPSGETKRRGGERRNCDVSCRISTRSGELNCRINNASDGGIGLTLHHLSKLNVGDRVRIVSGPLSGLAGNIRWSSVPKYGLQFDSTYAGSPAARAFVNSLPAS